MSDDDKPVCPDCGEEFDEDNKCSCDYELEYQDELWQDRVDRARDSKDWW